MKVFIAVLLFLYFTSSCTYFKENKVVITKEYIINPNWDEVQNYFFLYRMKLKDSTKTIDLRDPSEAELYHGLVKDPDFSFYAKVEYNGENYTKRKVYFNKDNGFLWCRSNQMHSPCNQKILGELQPGTWYLLTGLSKISTTMHYIYIDNLDSLHVFKVSTMTNY